MKKGRISKDEEAFIRDNLHLSPEALGEQMDRDPNSLIEFIKRKVASGDFIPPKWLDSKDADTAHYNLISRPYWKEIEAQFTNDEQDIFKYHWTRIISQFNNEVIPTEELQVVDLIKMDILMNRALRGNKENLEQIRILEELITAERQRDVDQQDRDELFNMERQVASLKASQESLNKDYRELQSKKNSMLKDMRATREQRVKRIEDSKSNFTSWVAYLVENPDVAMSYGVEMEKMRLAMDKEKERLSQFHKYNDDMVDQPFLTPETVRDN
jgi:hypothetical protein